MKTKAFCLHSYCSLSYSLTDLNVNRKPPPCCLSAVYQCIIIVFMTCIYPIKHPSDTYLRPHIGTFIQIFQIFFFFQKKVRKTLNVEVEMTWTQHISRQYRNSSSPELHSQGWMGVCCPLVDNWSHCTLTISRWAEFCRYQISIKLLLPFLWEDYAPIRVSNTL